PQAGEVHEAEVDRFDLFLPDQRQNLFGGHCGTCLCEGSAPAPRCAARRIGTRSTNTNVLRKRRGDFRRIPRELLSLFGEPKSPECYTSQSATASRRPWRGSRVGMNSWPT